MSFRVRIAYLLCLALILVRVSGVHAHLSLEHDHDDLGSHDTVVETLIADHDATHLESHVEHGDVDVDAAANAFGKLSALKLPAALITLIVLLVPLVVYSYCARRPPPKPPDWRRHYYLSPPSHAPPARA